MVQEEEFSWAVETDPDQAAEEEEFDPVLNIETGGSAC